MEVIAKDYFTYNNLHTKLNINEGVERLNICSLEIMEDVDFYYIFSLFGTFEIIIKLDKKIKKEGNFRKIINYLKKNKSYDMEIIKSHQNRVKEFILRIMNVNQFDEIIRKKEEISFEKGKLEKIKEIKDMFNIGRNVI